MCCLQIFPHHENELAQSQACACDSDRAEMADGGKDFVRFWMHNGFVNGELACSGVIIAVDLHTVCSISVERFSRARMHPAQCLAAGQAGNPDRIYN